MAHLPDQMLTHGPADADDPVFVDEQRGKTAFVGELTHASASGEEQRLAPDLGPGRVWSHDGDRQQPVAATHELLRALREAGLRCYLATNQAEHRGVHMRDELGYAGLFDGAFYSYEMGVAKPDPAYFRHIVEALGVPADQLLFLDDRPDNVESARSVGLRAEVWSYHEDLSVLHDHLARHGVEVPQLSGGTSGVS